MKKILKTMEGMFMEKRKRRNKDFRNDFRSGIVPWHVE